MTRSVSYQGIFFRTDLVIIILIFILCKTGVMSTIDIIFFYSIIISNKSKNQLNSLLKIIWCGIFCICGGATVATEEDVMAVSLFERLLLSDNFLNSPQS